MPDLTLSATEHGMLRIFALSSELSAQLEADGSLDALGRAVGVEISSADDVQILSVDTLGELGLSGLLREGYDVTPSLEDSLRLDALGRDVALIRSAAFGGVQATFLQTGDAELIATYAEGKAPAPKFTQLESDAAKGVLGGPAAEAPEGRNFAVRLTLIALAAMIAAFFWVFSYYIGF
ncbi:hypothetical protein [Litoreibacter janthinus]|uniref:Uncharacterized protein n=1 Tax=Litoreibacter janthinus TaxID=670154 RepID=A0A1I6G612_9RHOB|nr:hypothetical protein [Litoreibacter janthinus]SFR37477.1 hypothetical protein SAMN04488002_0935 [Litoreibacter janthinus]